MSEKPLLLSSAKSGVIVHGAPSRGWRIVATLFGLLVVCVGASDVLSRVSHTFIAEDILRLAFAPAITTTLPAASTTPLTPARISIPSIRVGAVVEQVGKKADGTMGTPTKFDEVAWYALGSKPGSPGNAVIAGHVNNALTTAGVFANLSHVRLGDTVDVVDENGHSLTYVVKRIEQYPADTAPAAEIFATTGPSQLVLITCDGEWVQSDHSFDKRLVVFASLH